ncbi:hypothetical protein QBC34DRAFT_473070 [Podospora aff. communis PSN243]|uniref:BTB domain-containing protein n=1 Tax=Podospora aff. communis PSN243 TaxID=3040156 RepID=A0AAV9G9B3_9PEZI|nr:hypothetical protein QBC34DRAFT_473070 [Podospora aff. communis PSN243]
MSHYDTICPTGDVVLVLLLDNPGCELCELLANAVPSPRVRSEETPPSKRERTGQVDHRASDDEADIDYDKGPTIFRLSSGVLGFISPTFKAMLESAGKDRTGTYHISIGPLTMCSGEAMSIVMNTLHYTANVPETVNLHVLYEIAQLVEEFSLHNALRDRLWHYIANFSSIECKIEPSSDLQFHLIFISKVAQNEEMFERAVTNVLGHRRYMERDIQDQWHQKLYNLEQALFDLEAEYAEKERPTYSEGCDYLCQSVHTAFFKQILLELVPGEDYYDGDITLSDVFKRCNLLRGSVGMPVGRWCNCSSSSETSSSSTDSFHQCKRLQPYEPRKSANDETTEYNKAVDALNPDSPAFLDGLRLCDFDESSDFDGSSESDESSDLDEASDVDEGSG